MTDIGRAFRLALVALGLVHIAMLAADLGPKLPAMEGLVFGGTASPLGGDFINLYAAARLVLEGRVAEIYSPDALMAFERTIIPHEIGLRLWAYPPTSLLLAWPLGLIGFVPALVLWSLLGLAVLAWGARRFGFGPLETAVIVLSPAAMSSIIHGQTGNLMAGLLLIALSARRQTDAASIVATTLLTIKPQLGFLLPLLWLIQRKLVLIGLVILAIAVLGTLAVALFGLTPWRLYLAETLPLLSALEQHGTGPFMMMIPSAFVAVRIVTGDPALAGWMHLAVAAGVLLFAIWRLMRTAEPLRQAAIVLAATALVTPYVHVYDLAPLVAAALLTMRLWSGAPRVAQLLLCFVVLAAWAMPMLTHALNAAGVPLTPLILVMLLVLAAMPAPRSSREGSDP